MKKLLIASILLFCTSLPCHAGLFSKDVPVKVEFRKAVLDDSLVAKFTNTTKDKHLIVLVTLTNKTLGQKKKVELTIGPGKTKEIGWAQGWQFGSGEVIKIEHSDYSSVTVKVP